MIRILLTAMTVMAFLLPAETHATLMSTGTVTIDWSSLTVTGDLSTDTANANTGLYSDATNTGGFDDDSASAMDWTTSISTSAMVDDDSSSASATSSQLQVTSAVIAATATNLSGDFAYASSDATRGSDQYLVKTDGVISIQVDFAISASGSTDYIGELIDSAMWANLELYVVGIGVPVASDSSGTLAVNLVDGDVGVFSDTGTLTVMYTATAGQVVRFAAEAWSQQYASSSVVPEPSILGLLGFSLAGLGFTRSRMKV